MPKALVVDDDAVSRLVLAHLLRRAHFTVSEADSVHNALTALSLESFDVVFSDHSMPGATGLDLARTLAKQRHRPAFVLITGVAQNISDGTTFDGVNSDGAVDLFITKPVSSAALVSCLGAIGLSPE